MARFAFHYDDLSSLSSLPFAPSCFIPLAPQFTDTIAVLQDYFEFCGKEVLGGYKVLTGVYCALTPSI